MHIINKAEKIRDDTVNKVSDIQNKVNNTADWAKQRLEEVRKNPMLNNIKPHIYNR